MRRRRVIFLAASIALVLAATILCSVNQDREPRYGGRSLSSWLALTLPLLPGPPTGPGWEEPREAIERIGTNALPCLMDWLQYERPAWRGKLAMSLARLPGTTTTKEALRKIALGKGDDRAAMAII